MANTGHETGEKKANPLKPRQEDVRNMNVAHCVLGRK
jgi:hypothetical protein